MIIFGSVRFFSKKVTKPNFFFLKKKTETGSNRPVSVRFGFLGQKPVQTGLARFFRFWLGFLGFFRFGLVFSGLARFFPVWLGFGSVRFFGYKTETEPTGRFFQKFNRFNRFFFPVRFFRLFFFRFSRFNRFSGFFAHP